MRYGGNTFRIHRAIRQNNYPAISETAAALNIAEKTETRFLIVHLAMAINQAPYHDNGPKTAMYSLKQLHNQKSAVWLHLALTIILNRRSSPASLIRLFEQDSNLTGIRLCFDRGRACLIGDLIDKIEIASEHMTMPHLSDNLGSLDELLVPGDGKIC